nr:GNAT family N-acetyltransferase [uncultured Roseococcus sp.]
MQTQIAAVSAHPELAPLVARWRMEAFGRPGGPTVEEMTASILSPPQGLEETFVVFRDGRPAGTAAIVGDDLDARPDLGPWLAWVFVDPAFRGQNCASEMVRHAEGFAAAASVPILWLHTAAAEGLYGRLGWERVGTEQDHGKPVVLMRRDLGRI